MGGSQILFDVRAIGEVVLVRQGEGHGVTFVLDRHGSSLGPDLRRVFGSREVSVEVISFDIVSKD